MKQLASVILLTLGISASARQITPGEAMTLASDFMNNSELQSVTHGSKALRPMRAPGVEANLAESPYYVFNRGEADGFVIISGDDRAPKILGYSDKGSFDADNLPPQLKAMMEQWATQMTKLPASAPQHASWTATASTRSGEGILMETAEWGQGYPYNEETPLFDGNHAPTGCVATAMAIAMKYHSWPETYDWESMPMKFVNDGENPVAPNPELARLMKDAGAAVCMTYDLNESYATYGWIGAQLRNVFDYNPDCQYITPSHFSNEEWIGLLKSNLENGNPVIYCGRGSGNHAFIIDGYNTDLYHINWGWDGYCNGYFYLESLNPNDVQSFSDCVGMAINITPNNTGKRYSECFVDCGYLGGILFANGLPMNISVEDIKKGEPFDVSLISFVKPEGFIGEIGLAIVDDNEYIKEVLKTTPLTADYAHSSTYDYVGLCANEDITPTDRLQIVTKRENDNDYKLVIGTLEKRSYISVVGNKPEMTTIKCDVEKGIDLQLLIGETDDYNIKVKNGQIDTHEVLKGLYIGYECQFENSISEDSNKIIALRLTSTSEDANFFQSGKLLNRMRSPFTEDYYEITVKSVDLIDKDIEVSEPGTLEQLIPEEDAIRIANLSVSGNINSKDIAFINKGCSALITLDMSKAEIKETLYDDGSFVVSQANTIPYMAFDGYYLSNLVSLIFPETLEGFGEYSLIGLNGITKLLIPEKVKYFGKAAIYSCQNLNTICLLNPEPVSLPDEVFLDTRCPEDGTLYVPVGSAEKFKQTPVWQDFKEIIEGRMPIKVKTIAFSANNWSGEEGESFRIDATVLPEDATDKSLVWSSSDETVATVDSEGNVSVLKEGSCVITATAADGSGVSAECIITSAAGVEGIFSEDENFDIYGLDGILVRKDADREALKNLTPGIYIVRQGCAMRKLVIR